MSSVLDALKKSADERKRENNQHYDFLHDPVPVQTSLRLSLSPGFILFFSLTLVATVCAGIWFLKFPRPFSPEQTEESTATDTFFSPSTESPPEITEINNAPGAATPPGKLMATKKKKIKKIKDEVPDLQNLPRAIQNGIISLRFAGHAYSINPEKRIIIINNTILREGDRINSRLRLAEITPAGVILEQDGQKFSIRLE
jgi:hypothetical protein